MTKSIIILMISALLLSGCLNNGSNSSSRGKGITPDSNNPTPPGDKDKMPDLSNLKFTSLSKTSHSSGTYLIGKEVDEDNKPYARIVKLNSDGELDTSFAGNLTDLQILSNYVHSEFNDLTEQNDGKILVVGSGFFEPSGIEVIALRFNTDGTIDEDFGNAGLASFSLSHTNPNTIKSNAIGKKISLLPDGKILLLANNEWHLPGNNYGFDVNLIKLLSNGQIDISFGTNGYVTSKYGQYGDGTGPSVIFGNDLVVANNGTIVVAGYSFVTGNPNMPNVGDHFTLLRYLSSGIPDPNFGSNGLVRLEDIHDSGNNSAFQSLSIQDDGKIIAGGYFDKIINNLWHYQAAVVRFNPSGTLDQTFNADGIAEISADYPRTLFDDIKYTNGQVIGLATQDYTDSYLYSFDDDGSSNLDFGSNGILRLLDLPDSFGTYFGISIDDVNNIWVGGTVEENSGFNIVKIDTE